MVSATPGNFEKAESSRIVEQIVRPTGIVDPYIEVRETKNQIDDLMNEARVVAKAGERVLVTTLTKKMAEDLTAYLLEYGIKVRYLHSEIDTLERIQIVRDLRLGEYDVLVGVNLLREGLDLPEVSLVAILDADKEGFLRGETSLVQTIGRAARNVNGRVLMYADKETDAMRAAMSETDRRRAIQLAYNEEHGITPETVRKGISEMSSFLAMEDRAPAKRRAKRGGEYDSPEELEKTIVALEEEMLAAADDLRFEEAGRIRDELRELRRDLDGMTGGGLRTRLRSGEQLRCLGAVAVELAAHGLAIGIDLEQVRKGGLEAPFVVGRALGAAHHHPLACIDELLRLDAERRPVVGDLGEVGHDRVAALYFSSQRQLVRGDPDRVLGKLLLQGTQVAAPEGVVGGPGGVDVGHLSSSVRPCLNPT